MDDDGNDCCVKEGKGKGIVFVGVLAVFLLGLVGVAGNNVGWFEDVISDSYDPMGHAAINTDDPVETTPVVENPVVDPVVEYTVDSKKVVDTRSTVMTSNGEIKGTIVDKAGKNHIVVELDGERLPDYEFGLTPAIEKVYERKGLGDIFNKYDIKNHAIEKFNTNGKPGYDNVKVFINVDRGTDGSYDLQNTGTLVYDGENIGISFNAIDYVNLCSQKSKEILKEDKDYIKLSKGCIEIL